MIYGIMGAILTVAGAIVIGIPMIAFGQLLLVFREVALNTRSSESTITTQYRTLESLAALLAVIGWIILIGGIVVAAWSFITGVSIGPEF
jgi:hypothetical protein